MFFIPCSFLILSILANFLEIKAENPYAYGYGMNNQMIGGIGGSDMRGSVYPNSYTTNFPYGRQKFYPDEGEVYIRKTYDRQYLGGMGNQMLLGNAGSYSGMNINNMNMYGNGYINRPRFGFPEMMGGAGQPIVINGYPMYPKNSYSGGYPMVMSTSIPMSSLYGSPTIYQGPTVSRLPFRASV